MADVLVVDDDEAIRRLLSTVLRRDGHSVDDAGDGVAALEKLHARPYAAVVLDLMMPRMTGWEVLDVLAREDAGRLGRVIVLSAAVPRKGLPSEVKERVYAVMSKPFELDKLRGTIRACVEREGINRTG